MMTNPWYSTEDKHSVKETAVHHHNTQCKAGQRIEKNHRRYGTDNRPLCKICNRLDGLGR